MNKIFHYLLYAILVSTISLHASDLVKAKRKRQPSYNLYILSEPYLTGLQEQSEEKLKLLEDLHEAVEEGSLNELDELLRKHPSECGRLLGKYQEKSTSPPIFHLAIVRGKKEIIRTILPYITDINIANETPFGNNNTALHCATQLRKPTRPQICQILIAAGADVNIKNKLGETPLHKACEFFDDPFVVKIIIYHGADIHSQTYQGRTPLHIAVANQNINVVKTLLACGAKPLGRDYYNKTPIQIAKENVTKNPNNPVPHDILACLEAEDTFDAFIEDLFNFDKPASNEPANKRRRIDHPE